MFDAYPLVLMAGLITITLFHLTILFFKPKRFLKEWLIAIFSFHLLTALALQQEVNDVALFGSVGYMFNHKLDIYLIDSSHGTYPFWPFTIYPYALFWWLSAKIPFLTFSFWVKCLLIPIFFLTASLIAKTLRQQGLSKPQTQLTQLLLVTNPLLFLVITFHGQADILLIYFFLLSVYFLLGELILAGIFMAFSVMTKTWSVMFLPLIALYLKSLKKTIIFLAIFFLTILAFGQLYQLFVYTSFIRLFQTVLSHPSGASGHWGLTAILPYALGDFYNSYRFGILFLGFLGGLGLFYLKQPPLLRQAKIFILIVYALTAGWGLQYSAWIIPLAAADRDWRRLKLYTLLTLPYLGFSYFAISAGWNTSRTNEISLFLSLFSWGFSLYWLFSELKVLYLSKTADHIP